MGFPPRPTPNQRLTCPSLAMALLIASTGPLPVLAAGRTISPLSDPASPLGGVQSSQLLANQQETDEKEKKKKKANRN